MIRKFIILGILCAFSMDSFAQKIKLNLNENREAEEQISNAVREKIEEYAFEIRKIVIDEKVLMNEEISGVNLELKNNSITLSEAENRKSEISQKYAERINQRISQIDFDLDEITKKQVEYTILNTDVEKLSKEKHYQSLEDNYKAKNEVTGFLSYGLMHFEDGDDESLNNHLGYSSGIDAGFLYHRQFNRTSPWEFITGVYFSWRTLRFDDDYMINRSEDGEVTLVPYDKNLKKSKLRSTYVMVPVGIKFNISPLKQVTDGFSYRNTSQGISLGANLYGGFRISKNNIVKGDDISHREKDTNYNLSPFVYGAQITLGIDNINFFVRQDFSSYFEKNTFDDRKMLQFGINLGF